jgi:type IV pilus assembly protein PilP
MGTDHGRISRISEASIDLIEIVPDGVGGWVERERTVSLGTQRG